MNLKGMANDSMAEQNYPQSISIREITEYNFDAVISMRRPDGEKFVAPNSYSLAQAWVYRNNNDVFHMPYTAAKIRWAFYCWKRIMKSESCAYGESCSQRNMYAKATEQLPFRSF